MAWLSSRPVGASKSPEGLEVPGHACRSDVLEHPDRRDGVELLPAQVPVVLEPDLDLVGEPGLDHPSPGFVDLVRGSG